MIAQVEKKARQYISLCNIMKRNSTRPVDALPAMAPRINAAKEQCAGEGSSRRGNGGDAAGAGAGGVGGIGGASGKSHLSHKRSASLMIPFVIVQTDPNNDIHLEWRKEKKEALLRSVRRLSVCVVCECVCLSKCVCVSVFMWFKYMGMLW